MKRTLIRTNEDGSPHYHYECGPDEAFIKTGPIVAVITTEDGTEYDVSDAGVVVKEEHNDEVMHAIGDHYEKYGHPLFKEPDKPFKHDRQATAAACKTRKAALAKLAKKGS